MKLAAPQTSHTQSNEVLILGIGNSLMGDDGVGIRVAELLARENLPPGVIVQEVGLPGWGLPSWFEGNDNVILVDAIQMGNLPGGWRRFLPEDIQLEVDPDAISLHFPDLACGLALSEALDLLPKNLIIYGIEPDDLKPGATLSPAVEASLPEVIASIKLDMEMIKE